MPILLGPEDWIVIITHVKKWVTNLLRAKAERKKESKEALRAVVIAVRKTSVYLNILQEVQRDLQVERELAVHWTELSFRLEDIKLAKLAKKCHLSGKEWADQGKFDEQFFQKAKNRLQDIEEIANTSLQALKKKKS